MISKDQLYEENQRLKAILAQHGIPWTGSVLNDMSRSTGSSTSYNSSASVGSFSGPSTGATSPNNMNSAMYDPSTQRQAMPVQQFRDDIEYDTAGIDFVLTYAPSAPSTDHSADPARRYLTPPPQ